MLGNRSPTARAIEEGPSARSDKWRVDGPRHDVAGRELIAETAAGLVDQHRPLAPQRLGQQRHLVSGRLARRPQLGQGEGGRVELHELEIGQGRARPVPPWPRRRRPPGRRGGDRPQVGVARRSPAPRRAPTRRPPAAPPASGSARRPHRRRPAAGRSRHGRVDRSAPPGAARRGDVERPHQLRAGGVPGVHDALRAVGRLPAERRASRRRHGRSGRRGPRARPRRRGRPRSPPGPRARSTRPAPAATVSAA